MISSIGKQNIQPAQYPFNMRPSHQGRAFKIDLGHSNGPFLSKDVMHSNQKSTYLMAAKEVLQSHMSMSNMMSILSKEEEHQSKTIKNSSTVQNWFSKCEFIQGEIKYLQTESKKLGIQNKKLKQQIKGSFIRLVKQNEQITQNFMPLFKNLMRTIREQSQEQKNVYEERKRDIQDLTKFRNKYLDQLVGCEQRIMKTQSFLGIGSS